MFSTEDISLLKLFQITTFVITKNVFNHFSKLPPSVSSLDVIYF